MCIRRFLIYLFYLMLPGLALLYGCKKKESSMPVIGAITESVYASGFVKAEEQYNVVSSVPGILLKAYAKVGDIVSRGDSLFMIKNPAGKFTVENSELALKRAGENLKRIGETERQVELLRNKYQEDSLMVIRQRNLWNENVGTRVQLEQAELALKSSRTEYSNMLSQLAQTRAALRVDYETARNNVQIARENAEGYIVRSETDGRIYTIYPEEGEGITPQTVLAVVGKQDKFLVEIQVDEDDIARIQPGQEIFITMDSYKDSVFKARITKIYPIMNESTGTFTVEGVFTQRPSKLYPQLNLEANIFIGRKENVMIVPREYLVEDKYVLLEDGKKTKVNVGLKNFDYAEITGGLNKGQKIYKP